MRVRVHVRVRVFERKRERERERATANIGRESVHTWLARVLFWGFRRSPAPISPPVALE